MSADGHDAKPSKRASRGTKVEHLQLPPHSIDAEQAVLGALLVDSTAWRRTWVTAAMSARLSQFEDAIRKMGVQARFIDVTTGHPQYAEQRAAAITFVYAEFERILPHLFSAPAEDGIGSETIEERVREMLGVNQLVDMRTALIHRAHKAVL